MTAVSEPESTAIVSAPTRAALRVLRPLAAPAEMLKAQNETRAFIEQVLEKDRDYGVIPGVKKPTLLKPGAEKVTLAFGCSAVPRILEQEIDHDRAVTWQKRQKKWNNAHRDDKTFTWAMEEGQSLGLYRYVLQVDIVDEHGQVRGSGVGSCSSMESKYVDRPRDCENTILKMAMKRAHVAAVLSTFGLSEQFTQDVEEMPHVAEKAAERAAVAPGDKTWPRWPNYPYAGKPFKEIPTEELTAQLTKCRERVEKLREKKDDNGVRMGEMLTANIEAVLEDRRANPQQAAAAFSGTPSSPVASAGKETASTSTATTELEGDDDELPF